MTWCWVCLRLEGGIPRHSSVNAFSLNIGASVMPYTSEFAHYRKTVDIHFAYFYPDVRVCVLEFINYGVFCSVEGKANYLDTTLDLSPKAFWKLAQSETFYRSTRMQEKNVSQKVKIYGTYRLYIKVQAQAVSPQE